jgi:Family of unknown function (DUF6958)
VRDDKSTTEDRVVVRNPNTGRDDGTIARALYEPVRTAILEAVAEAGTLPLSELRSEVERRTPPTMWDDASVGWYTTTVKLDLEAKGLILKEGSPQVLRVTPNPA